MKRISCLMVLCAVLLIVAIADAMVDVQVFSQEFIRATGKPVTETYSFPGRGSATIMIFNGAQNAIETGGRVSSSTITVNGIDVFDSSDFNEKVTYLEKQISLNGEPNTISVQLRGKPGAKIRIVIYKQIEDKAGYISPVDYSQVITDNKTGIQIVKNQLIIFFKETVSTAEIQETIDSINGIVVGYIPILKLYQIQLLGVETSEGLLEIIDILNSNPNIEHVSRNMLHSITEVEPNDPKWENEWKEQHPSGKNWGLEAIKMPSAWELTKGGTQVRVGIVDGGFLLNHEDINLPSKIGFSADGKILSEDNNIHTCSKQSNAIKNNNHGTHVLGIIGAESNDGKGITGIMWEKDLYLYRTTLETDTDIIHGIHRLLIEGVKIINLSLGINWKDPNSCLRCFPDLEGCPSFVNEDYNKILKERMIYEEALDEWKKEFDDKEFLIVQAAGNDNIYSLWGGNFNSLIKEEYKRHIITVGSIDMPEITNGQLNYRLSDYSNYGEHVDIVAPGGNSGDGRGIYSTIANPPYYLEGHGTSMAAPYVTGVASLVWNLNPELSSAEVKNILLDSAQQKVKRNNNDFKEYGILNAYQAVYMASAPQVKSFNVSANQLKVGEILEVEFEVYHPFRDLSQIVLWRADDVNGFPGTWEQMSTEIISANSFSGRFTDTPLAGTYWYGIHVTDSEGVCATEGNMDCNGSASNGKENFKPKIVRVNSGNVALSPPTGTIANYEPENNWIRITWNEVPKATSYNLYWGTEPGVTGDSEPGGSTGGTVFTHTGVVSGYTYYYRITSIDADGNESDLSEQVSAYVPFGSATGLIPDTGQTTCYGDVDIITCPNPSEPFYGQDGNYIINPPSYTKLDEIGNDLPDTAIDWAMIRDNVSGLIWESKTDDGSIHDKDHLYTWNGHYNFISQLNEQNFGGYDDWRMPTAKELAMLMYYDKSYPTIDTDYFPNTMGNQAYWSSTIYANAGYAMIVTFDHGVVYLRYRYNSDVLKLCVRGVRGNEVKNNFVDNGDETISDNSLVWQKEETTPMKWEQALDYCENLELGNHKNWRLPNRNELLSLVDPTLCLYSIQPAIDLNAFPGASSLSSLYWSATTKNDDPTGVYYVRFGDGVSAFTNKSNNTLYVRCVRDEQQVSN